MIDFMDRMFGKLEPTSEEEADVKMFTEAITRRIRQSASDAADQLGCIYGVKRNPGESDQELLDRVKVAADLQIIKHSGAIITNFKTTDDKVLILDQIASALDLERDPGQSDEDLLASIKAEAKRLLEVEEDWNDTRYNHMDE